MFPKRFVTVRKSVHEKRKGTDGTVLNSDALLYMLLYMLLYALLYDRLCGTHLPASGTITNFLKRF